jgi:hypothetical protein
VAQLIFIIKEMKNLSTRDLPSSHIFFRYRWLASKWSPCVVTFDEPALGPKLVEVGCGGGVQLREVTCVQASQGSQPVSDELCESLEPLPTVQRSVPAFVFCTFF